MKKGRCKYLYTARAVAEFVGQSVRTVRRKIRVGKIRSMMGAGGAVAVRLEDAVAAAAEARRERRGRKKGGVA